jgi:urate oxidase
MSEELGYLSAARYGKDLVRVFRVVREGDKHHVAEYTVKGERAFWMSC